MRFLKMTDEDWDLVIDTNLRSQFLCCRAALPGMVERGYGRIVNISSRAWLGGFGQANYSAAKGGVVSLTRIAGDRVRRQGRDGQRRRAGHRRHAAVPQLRARGAGAAEGLGAGAAASARPRTSPTRSSSSSTPPSSYVTGQTLYVCGGRSLSSPSV